MPDRASKDQLSAIWTLVKVGWKFRRIARLILPRSHHTVRGYYEKACEEIESGNLPILAKDEKALRIRYVGSSKDIEYIHGKIKGNQCGGGRRVKPHIYDDEYKDISKQLG